MSFSRHPTPDAIGPGQESVWSYPRPPRIDPSSELVEIYLGAQRVASTTSALRVLETSHPPVYYLPAESFEPGVLRAAVGFSYCEFKGAASYLDIVADGEVARRAGWTYPDPSPGFADLLNHVAVYAAAMTRCTVDGETVQPQPGHFYGGWVTSRVVGPFKGAPGSLGW